MQSTTTSPTLIATYAMDRLQSPIQSSSSSNTKTPINLIAVELRGGHSQAHRAMLYTEALPYLVSNSSGVRAPIPTTAIAPPMTSLTATLDVSFPIDAIMEELNSSSGDDWVPVAVVGEAPTLGDMHDGEPSVKVARRLVPNAGGTTTAPVQTAAAWWSSRCESSTPGNGSTTSSLLHVLNVSFWQNNASPVVFMLVVLSSASSETELSHPQPVVGPAGEDVTTSDQESFLLQAFIRAHKQYDETARRRLDATQLPSPPLLAIPTLPPVSKVVAATEQEPTRLKTPYDVPTTPIPTTPSPTSSIPAASAGQALPPVPSAAPPTTAPGGGPSLSLADVVEQQQTIHRMQRSSAMHSEEARRHHRMELVPRKKQLSISTDDQPSDEDYSSDDEDVAAVSAASFADDYSGGVRMDEEYEENAVVVPCAMASSIAGGEQEEREKQMNMDLMLADSAEKKEEEDEEMVSFPSAKNMMEEGEMIADDGILAPPPERQQQIPKSEMAKSSRKKARVSERRAKDKPKESEQEKADKKKKQKEKEDEQDIDQMFADLETVVKYIGKLLYAGTRPPEVWYTAPVVFLRCLLAIAFTLSVLVLVVIPTFYAVLVVRMVKVEVSKESFVKRAAIIAKETAAKHAMRIGRLFLRSLPLAGLIVIVPPVVMFGIVGNHYASDDDRTTRRWIGFGTIIVYTCAITILQIQGTVRAIITFRKSEEARLKTQTAASIAVQKWWRLCLKRFDAKRQLQQRKTEARKQEEEKTIGVVSLSPEVVPRPQVPSSEPLLPPLPGVAVFSFGSDEEEDRNRNPAVGTLNNNDNGNPQAVGAVIGTTGLTGVVPEPDVGFSPRDALINTPSPAISTPTVHQPFPPPPPVRPPRVTILRQPRIKTPSMFQPTCADHLRNLTIYVAILVEGIQLSALGLRAVPLQEPDLDANFWVDAKLLPAVFIRFPDPSMVMVWIAIAIVAFLITVICGRMMYEMWQFEANGGAFGSKGADSQFFHGFLGSILYGHGSPKHVPKLLCTVVSVICDLLFFTIISNLSAAFSCFTDGERHPTDSELDCWGSAHRTLAMWALIAFGYFIPLSIMVAPVLSEANKKTSAGAISISKPYSMIVNVAKVVAVVFIVLISTNSLGTIITATVLCSFLAILTATWSKRAELKQPASVPHVNIARVSAAIGALICALVAVVVYAAPDLRTPYRYIVVLVTVVVFQLGIPVWAAVWRK